ncbi:hypothetical protein H5410_028719 [Solanum commersonii]|uniref:Uncharacterized protein n=1 Tax=Solanum commersonii TaxID=4109 RepID=A0A9J5Z2Q1_SOLCO|nr:hypothetical protein H5410_028719 [Solanum commersonii]
MNIIVGKLMIPFFEMIEYILRYWTFDAAKSLENGFSVPVDMWDVTEENIPKKYEGGSVCLGKLYNDDFYLLCFKFFNRRGLSVGDEIGIYWDPRSSSLMFNYLLRFVLSEMSKSLGLKTTYHSLFNTFFYNFFPSKSEEDACKLNNTPHVVNRELIEIRDIYPPSKIDLENP